MVKSSSRERLQQCLGNRPGNIASHNSPSSRSFFQLTMNSELPLMAYSSAELLNLAARAYMAAIPLINDASCILAAHLPPPEVVVQQLHFCLQELLQGEEQRSHQVCPLCWLCVLPCCSALTWPV